ncbi:unnamed protein product [Closterium sp. NIES-65]|nr:unnamed protein product [Closterium sp. NIES-65]
MKPILRLSRLTRASRPLLSFPTSVHYHPCPSPISPCPLLSQLSLPLCPLPYLPASFSYHHAHHMQTLRVELQNSTSAHAESIRAKVRGVGKSLRGLEGRKAQGGKGGDERGEDKEERSGDEEGKEDQGKKEKEEEGGEGEKEAKAEAGEGEKEAEEEKEGGGEGKKIGGMRDEEGEKTIDLVDGTTEEGDEENLKKNSAGEAREELTLGLQNERGEAPVEASGEGLGRELRGTHAAEREGETEACEGDDEEAEEDAMQEGQAGEVTRAGGVK